MTTFGLFLNLGARLADDHAGVYRLALEQADAAETLGYHDAWVTEHHFIPFGVCSNALTLAGFLLGRTRRLRVGTAVTLAPQYNALQLAEQAAILDQASGGRFDFGIGRGGYAADFAAFGVDPARWDDEIGETIQVCLDAWTRPSVEGRGRWHRFAPVALTPRPLSSPHPPLFAATATGASLETAAAHGLPLLHYFATPPDARVKVETAYAELRGGPPASPHVHALIVVVTDDEAGDRERLREALTAAFIDGDHPAVPQSQGRRAHGDRAELARAVAEAAIVGPPHAVAERLAAFRARTGAERLLLYMEAIGDRGRTLRSIERFHAEVRPRLEAGTPFGSEPATGAA
ncbi:LLM class flavin-dependent oxidoreductase [Phenylobacterium sp.]|uniref:LLM class flavin-dependent oxidoreductase n=1 Tax=Phenylobacterium sp. TaxID=1871053 RepID=UPI00301C3E8F